MVVARAQDFVHQIAIAGEENQPLGVLVQSANGEDPLTMAHMVDDVTALRRVGGADHAHGLVEGDKDQVLFVSRLDQLAVHRDLVAGQHLIAHLGRLAINGNVAVLDIAVGLPPGTHATLADVFVEAGGVFAGHGSPVFGRGSSGHQATFGDT